MEEPQERVVAEYWEEGWSRSTSYSRWLVTSLGGIELIVVKVRRGGRVTSPTLDVLGIRRRRYSNELRMLLADMAASSLTATRGRSSERQPESMSRSARSTRSSRR
jgi:hypothetical protein